jgi:tetratricopeptide (TPR) repeat protein
MGTCSSRSKVASIVLCNDRLSLSKLAILSQRRDLLRRVKEVGVEEALQEVATSELPAEVQSVIDELPQLVQTKDMPRLIELCRMALALISREQNLEWWAWLQNQLAHGLLATPIGSHLENVQAAIETLEETLQALDEREHSEVVADLRMNLTICHAELGEYNSSRELFLSMLEAKQGSSSQQSIANLLSNIGTTHLYSLLRDPKTSKHFSGRVAEDSETLERAIEFYEQARQNLTPEGDPVSWVNINTFLGMLYPYRQSGDPDQNNKLAIEACRQALSV